MRTVLVSFLLVVAIGCSANDSPPRATPGSGGSAGASTTGSSGASTGGGNAGSSVVSATSGGGAGSTGVGGSAGTSGAGGGSSVDAAGGAAIDAGPSEGGGKAGSTGADASKEAGIVCTPGTGTVDVGTKSLLDKKTCLVWEKAPSANMTNRQAAKYCDQLDQDGLSDWRVPTPQELATSPAFVTNGNAYITGPTYIPTNSASDQEGCTGNSHSCNLSQYNAGSIACAWQGVGFVGPALCVRGTAEIGSIGSTYAAASCTECSSHVTGAAADFKIADCLPFAP